MKWVEIQPENEKSYKSPRKSYAQQARREMTGVVYAGDVADIFNKIKENTLPDKSIFQGIVRTMESYGKNLRMDQREKRNEINLLLSQIQVQSHLVRDVEVK